MALSFHCGEVGVALPPSQGSQDDEEHVLTREEELEGSARDEAAAGPQAPPPLASLRDPGAFVSIPLTCTLWSQFTFAHKPSTLLCAHDSPPVYSWKGTLSLREVAAPGTCWQPMPGSLGRGGSLDLATLSQGLGGSGQAPALPPSMAYLGCTCWDSGQGFHLKSWLCHREEWTVPRLSRCQAEGGVAVALPAEEVCPASSGPEFLPP